MNSDIDKIKSAVKSNLPETYPPLGLSFSGDLIRPKDDYIVMGALAEGGDLGINVNDNCVYAIVPTCEIKVRFVNSGLEQFIAFFSVWNKYNDLLADSAVDGRTAARALRPRLVAIDSRALGDLDKWWEPAVEQLEDQGD